MTCSSVSPFLLSPTISLFAKNNYIQVKIDKDGACVAERAMLNFP